jgi:hypothetical protein
MKLKVTGLLLTLLILAGINTSVNAQGCRWHRYSHGGGCCGHMKSTNKDADNKDEKTADKKESCCRGEMGSCYKCHSWAYVAPKRSENCDKCTSCYRHRGDRYYYRGGGY